MKQSKWSNPRPEHGKRFGADPPDIKLWRRARMGRWGIAKRVVKCFANSRFDFRLAVHGNRVPQVKLKQPQIVQTENVVRMFVCKSDGVNQSDFFTQQLNSQFWWSVDQQNSFRQPNCHRTASSIVLRIVTQANAAPTPQGRNAHRSPAPQHNHFSRNVGSEWFLQRTIPPSSFTLILVKWSNSQPCERGSLAGNSTKIRRFRKKDRELFRRSTEVPRLPYREAELTPCRYRYNLPR